MDTLFPVAALGLGFLGSFHCVGMCGPIALAVPSAPGRRFESSVFYNAGRLTTYVLIGLLFGILGKGFAMAGLQRWLSVSAGVILILAAVLPALKKGSKPMIGFVATLKQKLGALFSKRSRGAVWLIGLLNGLLPCGLVYLAAAGAAASGAVWGGMMFMLFFGIGTLPVMLAMPLLRNLLSVSVRNSMRKAVPVFIVCMGLLLVLRGMNLGIPYISPSANGSCHGTHACCAHKK